MRAVGKIVLLSLFAAAPLHAMQSLDDEQLSDVSGAGVGFFAADFLYDQGTATSRIGGLRDSEGRELSIDIENVYVKGEGSTRGALETLAQVGSPMHPFRLNVVGQQRAPTLPAAARALQLSFPNYTDALNDNRQYGIWSLYQGCLLGTAGCTEPTRALTRIDEELQRLNEQRVLIYNAYGGQFANLKTGIDADMVLVTQLQGQLDVKLGETAAASQVYKARQQEFAQAGSVRDSAFSAAPGFFLEDGWLTLYKPSLGSKYLCVNACSNAAAQAYNLSVDAYNTAQAADTAALNAYNTKTTELSAAQQALGAAWAVTRNGQTLTTRQSDYTTYSALCGTPTQNLPPCTGGRIAKTNADRTTVTIVIAALQQGTRVKGIDLGLKTRFSLPSTAYTGSASAAVKGATTTRTDYFSLDIEALSLNNSYLTLWGDGGKLSLEASLLLYAQRLVLGGCRTCTDSNRLVASNVSMDINLGHGTYQPMTLASLANGELELRLPAVTYANHVNFYRNVAKSNISLGNVRMSNVDIGAQSIRGLRVDYLKMTTVKLPR